MFYRYIYYETVAVTLVTALPLAYAARKYLLTGLMKEILRLVEQIIDADTVCTLLERSVLSTGANEVKDVCLTFIRKEAHRVFKTEEFLHLSHAALQEIVRLSSLALTSEVQVYEYCMKWAKHQLRELGNECPSDLEIRDKLSSCLYQIRFPVMGAKEFAELTAQSTVLTAEEKHDIYVFMASGKSLETLNFVTRRRARMLENVIARFNGIYSRNCNGEPHAITFTATVNMYLGGVGLYGGITVSTHDVRIDVLKDGNTLSTVVTKMASNGRQCPIKFPLKNPVFIRANCRYTVSAVVKASETWAGSYGSGDSFTPSPRVVSVGPSATIEFHQPEILRSRCDGQSEISRSRCDRQIPELYYYLESK